MATMTVSRRKVCCALLCAMTTTLPVAAREFRGRASDRVTLEQDEHAEQRVHEGHERCRVLVAPRHDAWVCRKTLRTQEKDDFQEREGGDGHEGVRDAVRAKERDPHRQVVAAQREREHVRGEDTTAKLLTEYRATTPRVPREPKGRYGKYPDPANRYR